MLQMVGRAHLTMKQIWIQPLYDCGYVVNQHLELSFPRCAGLDDVGHALTGVGRGL